MSFLLKSAAKVRSSKFVTMVLELSKMLLELLPRKVILRKILISTISRRSSWIN